MESDKRQPAGRSIAFPPAVLFCFSAVLTGLLFSFFLIWYVKNGSADVAYSDYIRIINSYLPDALDPGKFFVPDILTRIPLTYFCRWLNMRFFSYSLSFDRLLGILGLTLSLIPIAAYVRRRGMGILPLVSLCVVLFSLNKWEMLLNGSGYAHFLSFALFYWHFLLLDVRRGKDRSRWERIVCLMIPFLCLLTAGPYVAVYLCCVMLWNIWEIWNAGKAALSEGRGMEVLAALAALLLYLLSNHFAVYEYAGVFDISLFDLFKERPGFAPGFLLNGLASMLLGGEILDGILARFGDDGRLLVYAMGLLVSLMYAVSIFLFVRKGLFRQAAFPFLLVLYGLGSHFIVFLSRYTFLRESYAWQSRYALQYQSGILGILLILWELFRREPICPASGSTGQNPEQLKPALADEPICPADGLTGQNPDRPKPALTDEEKGDMPKRCPTLIGRLAAAGAIGIILLGNIYTSLEEIRKMPYREERYEAMAEAAIRLEDYADEELEGIFEYRHGGERIRRAFGILKENRLNVYKGM